MADLPIAVTGAGGYVASWIVRELLSRGATVHATVRDKTNVQAYGHLRALAEDLPGRLEVFEADLMSEGSFDEAIAGCGVVVHAASPFVVSVKDPQRDLVDPAVKGTRTVLDSVERAPTVRRVVLTSSVVAVMGHASDKDSRHYDEADWNTTSTLGEGPYPLSKTRAEQEAWRRAEAQDRWDLVVINPGFVLGPSLSSRGDGISVAFISDLLDGTRRTGLPMIHTGVVDVRDVATAHVEAAVRPDASGRHLLVAGVLTYAEIAAILRESFPDRPLPRWPLPTPLVYVVGPFVADLSWTYLRRNLGVPFTVDNTRSRERLGIEYRPMAQTLVDHAQQLIDSGQV